MAERTALAKQECTTPVLKFGTSECMPNKLVLESSMEWELRACRNKHGTCQVDFGCIANKWPWVQAWHLQKCLEAKQHESKATQNAFGALKAEMIAVQTALTAAQQFEAAALSHHGMCSASNISSPRPLSSPEVPIEPSASSPDSGAYTARSEYAARSSRVTWTSEMSRYPAQHYTPSTAPSVARSNFSAWTDGGALYDRPAMAELKRQRDAAVQQAARARATLEHTKSAAAVNAHTASFYQVYSQVLSAPYEQRAAILLFSAVTWHSVPTAKVIGLLRCCHLHIFRIMYIELLVLLQPFMVFLLAVPDCHKPQRLRNRKLLPTVQSPATNNHC